MKKETGWQVIKMRGSGIFCVTKLDWQFIGDIQLRATFHCPVYLVTKNPLTTLLYCISMSHICLVLFRASSLSCVCHYFESVSPGEAQMSFVEGHIYKNIN